MANFAERREEMVERQIKARGLDDPHLLAAFRSVPRELFVPPENQAYAYHDGPLPIGSGQTISQPYIVALMIDEASVGRLDHVLEVGAGSGYAAALLGRMARDVIAVERIAALAEEARERIEELGLTNVEIVVGDGSKGWLEAAPYDAILVAAAGSHVPKALLEQLRCPGGRLVMPVDAGGWSGQSLVKVVRKDEESYVTSDLCGVRFVPLISD